MTDSCGDKNLCEAVPSPSAPLRSQVICESSLAKDSTSPSLTPRCSTARDVKISSMVVSSTDKSLFGDFHI